MRPSFAWLAAALLALGTTSCTGDGPDITWLRAVHTVPDAPTVRVVYDPYVFRATLSFGQSSNEVADSILKRFGPTGQMTAEYFGPGNEVGGTLLNLEVPIEKDHVTTVVLAGTFAEPDSFAVLSPRRERPLATLHFQFAHAVAELGPLDVYVTAPEVALTSTAPLYTVDPRGYTASTEVPFGETRVRLARAGTFDVVFDSGTLPFAEQSGPRGPGNEWLFTVAPSLDSGPSPVRLIANSGRNTTTVRNVDTPATARVYHALRGAPAVDLVARSRPEDDGDDENGEDENGDGENGDGENGNGEPAEEFVLATNLPYRERTPLLPAPTGAIELAFRLTEEPAETLTSGNVVFQPAGHYGVFLTGTLDEARTSAFEFQPRSVATESRLQFINLAPDSQFFSLYLTGSDDEELSASNRLARDLRFGNVSAQSVREPGEYFLTITQRFFETPEEAAAADDEVIIGPLPLEFFGGDVLLFALYPPEAEGEPEVLATFDVNQP